MSNSAAFFQILYQNETLFQLKGQPVQDFKKTDEPELKPAVPRETPPQTPKTEPAKIIPAPIAVNANPIPSAPKESFPALKYKILILLDEPTQQEMVPSQALLLDNILKAVGHSSENADVLNFSFLPGQDARSVLSEKKTNFFITFGVPLIRLHLDLLLAPYTPKLVDGIWFLLTDPLAIIETDRNLKKKLWQALQKMFEMS